ncbi:MAG: NADPH-dependent F420 reductase [Enterococcus italicus]
MSNKKIGVIGAGKLGLTLAQLGVQAGYDVMIACSRPPEAIALTVDVLAPGAKAVDTASLISANDVLILALPLSKFRNLLQLENVSFTDKLVIDAMNYWWEVDGKENAFSNGADSYSEKVQQLLPTAKVVKAFNHIGYHHLADEARAKGVLKRKAIAYAGDDEWALERVRELIESFGFDALPIGYLAEGVKLEPGSPLFGANLEKEAFLTIFNQLG